MLCMKCRTHAVLHRTAHYVALIYTSHGILRVKKKHTSYSHRTATRGSITPGCQSIEKKTTQIEFFLFTRKRSRRKKRALTHPLFWSVPVAIFLAYVFRTIIKRQWCTTHIICATFKKRAHGSYTFIPEMLKVLNRSFLCRVCTRLSG